MADETSIFRIDFQGSDEIIEKIAAIRKEQERLKNEVIKNTEVVQKAKDGDLEAAKAIEQATIQVKAYGKEINTLQKTIQTQDKAQKASTGSLNDMRSELKEMVRGYDDLSKEQRENIEVGGQMQRNIKELADEIMLLERETRRNQRNVGNYTDAINTANMSIDEMTKALAELRKMPLTNLSPEEILKAEQAMGQLTDALGKANARIRVQAMDDIPALVASLQGVVAASQLVVGSMALFGAEDERVEKLTQTMVQLIGVAQSLATVNQLIASGEAAALAVKVKTIAATISQSIATKTLAAAQWLWNKATMAFPGAWIIAGIAAVAAGIYLLIKNFDSVTGAIRRAWEWLQFWKDSSDEATKKTETFAEAQERLNKAFDRSSKSMEFEIKMLKALGADQDKIAEKERELLKLKADHLAINAVRIRTDKEATKEDIERAEQAARSAREELEIFEATENTRKRIAAEKEKEKQQQEIAKRAEDRKRKAAEDEKAAKEEAKREEKAALELAVVQAKTDEERLNAKIEQINRLAAIELESETLTQSERLLIVANAFNAESELRNQYAEQQIAAEKAKSDQIEKDRKELDDREKERLAAMQKFEQDITDARIDTAYALSDTFKDIAGEQSTIGKVAKAIQKGIALTEIGINLQRELAAIRVAAAAQNALLPGSGIITERIQSIKAIAMSGAGIAKVLALNSGGTVPGVGNTDTVPAMLTPGEGVLNKSAMTARDTFTVTGTPKQIASRLNTLYGGVEFRNRGGIIGTGQAAIATRQAGEQAGRESLLDAFSRVKIVTTVEDINNGLSSEAIRNQLANYV